MSNNPRQEDLSVNELEQLLYLKKRALRQKRIRRLREEGRLIQADGLKSPIENEFGSSFTIEEAAGEENSVEESQADTYDALNLNEEVAEERGIKWRWIFNKFLLLLEVGAVIGLVVVAFRLWSTSSELNQEIAAVQDTQQVTKTIPTETPEPIIGVAILPSGHKPPIDGRPPEPGEAGEIPEHLLPIINSYVPPPIPTPGPEQARRIQIPSINIDKPIVQGDTWEQLKKGVGQHIGSAQPGQSGNLVLSAHNDIYGEIFRHLDKLELGDEIIISTDRRSYTYIVNKIDVVAPTAVEVMAPTKHASTTLISCYPYLVNNKRIVVFADLSSNMSIPG